MSYRKLIVVGTVAGFLISCAGESASVGSYIASDDDTAFMVQITSIEEGRVYGTMSYISAEDDGKTEAIRRPMSGTIEGRALNLSVENGSGVSLVTGIVDGDKLQITFFADGSSNQLTFTRSEASKFPELANAMRRRTAEKQQEIETAAARKERMEQRSKIQKSIDQLADGVFAKAQEVQEKSKKIEVVIAAYRVGQERTGKMQNAKRRIDSSSSDGAYRISEIDYQIGSLSSDMEGAHSQVQSYMQSLNRFMADVASQSPQFLAECQADELLNCGRLTASLQSLHARYQQFQSVYQRENVAFGGKRGPA